MNILLLDAEEDKNEGLDKKSKPKISRLLSLEVI